MQQWTPQGQAGSCSTLACVRLRRLTARALGEVTWERTAYLHAVPDRVQNLGQKQISGLFFEDVVSKIFFKAQTAFLHAGAAGQGRNWQGSKISGLIFEDVLFQHLNQSNTLSVLFCKKCEKTPASIWSRVGPPLLQGNWTGDNFTDKTQICVSSQLHKM